MGLNPLSWMGGKNKEAKKDGPIKANLGSENSLVYDEISKRWVLKDGIAPISDNVIASAPPMSAPPPTPNHSIISSRQPSPMPTSKPITVGLDVFGSCGIVKPKPSRKMRAKHANPNTSG